MGYVIRGRTNHKSAPTLHFSLWLSHSLLTCSPHGFSVMFRYFQAGLMRATPQLLGLQCSVWTLEWGPGTKKNVSVYGRLLG